MKLAIVGTRELSGFPVVEKAVKRFLFGMESTLEGHVPVTITEIVSGGARGVDRLAERYAESINVPVKIFEPDPKNPSRHASMMTRNQEIVNYADAMVAIRLPDQSPGTDDAIVRMRAAGKPLMVFDLRPVFVEFSHGNRPVTPG